MIVFNDNVIDLEEAIKKPCEPVSARKIQII